MNLNQRYVESTCASTALVKHQAAAVQALLLITDFGSPVVSVAIIFRKGGSSLLLLAVITSVVPGILWLMLTPGPVRLATVGLVGMRLIGSTAGNVLS